MILQTCPRIPRNDPVENRDLFNDFNDLGQFRGIPKIFALSREFDNKKDKRQLKGRRRFTKTQILFPVFNQSIIFRIYINDLRHYIWGSKTGSKTGNRGKS